MFSPFAQGRGDLFHVETAPTIIETFSRGLGLAGAEISWPFMRPGERFDLIVEPVVMAAYRERGRRRSAHRQRRQPRVRTGRFQPLPPERARPITISGSPAARVSAGVRATARARTGESASLHVRPPLARATPTAAFTDANNLDGDSSDWVAAAQTDLGRGFAARRAFRLDDETLEVQPASTWACAAAIGRFSAIARYFNIDEVLAPTRQHPARRSRHPVGVELARGWRMQSG